MRATTYISPPTKTGDVQSSIRILTVDNASQTLPHGRTQRRAACTSRRAQTFSRKSSSLTINIEAGRDYATDLSRKSNLITERIKKPRSVKVCGVLRMEENSRSDQNPTRQSRRYRIASACGKSEILETRHRCRPQGSVDNGATPRREQGHKSLRWACPGGGSARYEVLKSRSMYIQDEWWRCVT